ncbi:MULTISPECIES: aspartate/glutamate racemase family protein [Yersinia]|uniref:Aspartate/glutamate racemase family protein n=1 Tax=Yersinia bercovieri TaxID=634 RepID=A0A2G4U5P2_YERBE|nr:MULTISPECIES: aspartate/glutamate racemase family protein [Yersinia]MDN0104482.1 aspartate/glutamate racemase family protein [Yersinia bercovieri]PHZ28641.1 aspartate/glutamate racemase family protein [Yersinia bercovieri]QDW32780.1 aspartate/glutamate racemase family protein [Yersinia sp. KBS0713]CFQ31669.1 putative aspartate/glutamate racemase [Yersinia bercovieri]CNI31557.1 putative aspartate/glutamate racemase [Yersinia bercovieri]
MKILGLIGGMSWESTIPYYRMINQQVKEQLGGLHSAKIILYSVDFHEIEQLQVKGDWQSAAKVLSDAAVSLKLAGAEVVVVCTNTMHKVADDIEAASGLPLLHIADATAAQIKQQGINKIGLLGTRYTMEQDFYRGRLTEKHDIEVITPDSADREVINRIIYEELCLGVINDISRQEYRRIIGKLEQQGVQGIIFGCTEITLLVNAQDASVPVFDTTAIHAKAAAEYALKP